MGEKRRQYDKDYKLSAVRLLEQSEQPCELVARGFQSCGGSCPPIIIGGCDLPHTNLICPQLSPCHFPKFTYLFQSGYIHHRLTPWQKSTK